tara:strand:- start:264039 stop:266102 length:2064 start_codon:yes stop_codon:yes gene_type:complete
MVAYFLVAIVAIKFAVIDSDKVTLLWPSSGLALVVLIRFGYRYTLSIFAGAFAAGLYIGDPLYVRALIALGNTLEPVLAVYILRSLPFSANLFRLNDYLSLIIAGSAGAVISALLGTTSLFLGGLISWSNIPTTVLHWWMGNALGVVLIAPFLLLFNFKTFMGLIRTQFIETLSLVSLSSLIALLVLTDQNIQYISNFRGTYLLAIPLTWSILRFGHVMTALIGFQYFAIGIWGLLLHQGIFVDSLLGPNLILFWAYFVAMALISLALSYIVSERNTLYQAINISETEIYVYCEGDMQFQFVNRAALDNLGLTLAEALKLTPLSLEPFLTQQQFQHLLTPLLNKEKSSICFESVHQRRDGSHYPIEITIQSIEHSSRQCYLASITDITARLEKEQHRILGNHVCDISPQAIMIINKDQIIIRINASFTRMTGYQAEEVLGKKPLELLNSGRHDKKFYYQLWRDLKSKGHWQGEIYNRRKNGELFLQDLTMKALYSSSGVIENSIVMFNDITQEREEILQIKHLSEHDLLTGLPNRRLLQQEFRSAKAAAKRNSHHLGFLFIDLNNFKPINDTFGHTYGDEVLQVIAHRMQACVREMDMVSREGGDEFIVLVTNIESTTACSMLADKLKSAIAKPIIVNDISLSVTASIGIASYPEHGDSLENLIAIADSAMYEEKKTVRDSLQTVNS